jgi:hypothetical protein
MNPQALETILIGNCNDYWRGSSSNRTNLQERLANVLRAECGAPVPELKTQIARWFQQHFMQYSVLYFQKVIRRGLLTVEQIRRQLQILDGVTSDCIWSRQFLSDQLHSLIALENLRDSFYLLQSSDFSHAL